jgi:multidrug efflux pump subunit AcrA (membrane-fusion protein)
MDILARRIELATLRAPFDGVVIRGDLRQSVGAVLAQGAPLFEVAPHAGWQVEIEAPEHAVADLAAGLTGSFTCQSRPERPHALRALRVHPGAEARHGKNVYLVEAALTAADEALRPGAEGVARIRIGPRRVWWVAAHRLLDALRLSYWL